MGKSSKTGKSKKDKGIVEETLVEEETMINEKTRVGTMLDGTDSAGPEAGKKSINEEAPESSGARDNTDNRNNTPTAQEQWDLMKGNDGATSHIDQGRCSRSGGPKRG